MVGHLKRAVKGFVPPVLWTAARWCRRAVAPRLPYRPVATLAEVDAELERANAALSVSHEASFAVLDSFGLAYPNDLPADPLSTEYRAREMAFYYHLSGRAEYRADVCEQIGLPADRRDRPYPYYTGSTQVIGDQLIAMGHVIRALAVTPPARVLEFGPGFGRLTLEMARSGFTVTAVEINPLYVDLIRHDAAREHLPVEVVQSGMLDFRPAARFDRVVFFESFHHCDDSAAMVARLDELVTPGGAVLFAGEPIDDDFPIPWGLRRDGRSLWAIRRFGWLELGFRTDFFRALLKRHGWALRVPPLAESPWQRVFVARRAGERS
jgi:SAM-dependent methyltransferase